MPAAANGPVRCPAWISPTERCKGTLLWDGFELLCTLAGTKHVPPHLRDWQPPKPAPRPRP